MFGFGAQSKAFKYALIGMDYSPIPDDLLFSPQSGKNQKWFMCLNWHPLHHLLPRCPTPPATPKPVVQKPAPKPTPPKPKPVVKKPTPKPKPKPVVIPPQPKKISFDQFRKQHDLPTPKPTVKQPPAKPVKIKINPNDFKLAPITVSTPSSTTSTVSPTYQSIPRRS